MKTCINCGNEFAKPYFSSKKMFAARKYCSLSCVYSCPIYREKRREVGKRFTGEKNPWWRGGVSPINKRLRETAEYKKWRTSVFERDDYCCQLCPQRGGKLNADHIKPFAYFPELRHVLSNGRTLCVSCHLKTDSYGRKAIINYA